MIGCQSIDSTRAFHSSKTWDRIKHHCLGKGYINESFINAGWMFDGQIAMINDEVPQEQSNWVRPSPPKFELGNSQIIEQPKIFVANIM